jgi:protoporphyrinogen oxidase
VTYKDSHGHEQSERAKNVISSAPIRELIQGLKPELKAHAHAEKLRYRDFITVAIILKDRNLFTDNWIYIHDPSVKVGRVQNFKSWSPQVVPNTETNCYGLEYFCFEGVGLWSSPDSELIALAEKELAQLGLAKKEDMIEGSVVRQQKAYPVYDDEYAQHVSAIRSEIERDYPGLHLVGRNGMHKYNNQDHAMMTAMLTVQNIVAGKQLFNVWDVNEDAEYHESGNAGASSTSGIRQVPRKV